VVRCCSNDDGEGLWYTSEYPAEVFFDHWTFLSQRYRNNPMVIGADLRNEIRGVPGIIFNFLLSFVFYFLPDIVLNLDFKASCSTLRLGL
jgi:hypothetical protein